MGSSHFRVLLLFIKGAAVFLLGTAVPTSAQEIEPRLYSAAPIGTNFLVMSYANSTGNVEFQNLQQIRDVRANIDFGTGAYVHTLNFAGRLGSVGVFLPYLTADVSGRVNGQNLSVMRGGFADLRTRLAINILGNPALTPAQFARRKPNTTVGLSETFIVPTGTYDASQPVNIGANRWGFKTEIGMEQPIGRAFVVFSSGVWVFTSNPSYLGSHVRSQAPIADAQAHVGYNFRPGQWVAVAANYYRGGATSVDGAPFLNELANARLGITYSQPVGEGVEVKPSWSRWLAGRYGQHFTTVGVAVQVRWFDRRYCATEATQTHDTQTVSHTTRSDS